MSQENVEIVRAYFSAWNAGGLDAARGLIETGTFGSRVIYERYGGARFGRTL